MSIWTLWSPDYGYEGLIKAITAAASIATAIALWPLLPRALALPSPAQLRAANADLSARIRERDAALRALEEATAERLRTEEMLRQAQKMEAIGQLTGGIAHDFNNMLAIVLANLERVERQLAPDSRLLKPVRDAITGAERAASVTHKLLAFARRQPLQPMMVEPNGLIEDLAELLRGGVGTQASLATDLGAGLWQVRVDPTELQNAILNLVVNARDAMAGQADATLAIRTRNVPAEEAARICGLDNRCDYVLIEVADTGIGMTEEVRSRAFEPFFTTKPLGTGTGLGLSQVFGFAKQSGGHALIESRPGSGTTVRLYLLREGVAPRPASTRTDSPEHMPAIRPVAAS